MAIKILYSKFAKNSKIATAIKRNRLRRQMSKAEREEKKAELYSRTLEEELDLV